MNTCCVQVDVNLICVDWENGATVPNYMRAASNTRLVGRQVSVAPHCVMYHICSRLGKGYTRK